MAQEENQEHLYQEGEDLQEDDQQYAEEIPVEGEAAGGGASAEVRGTNWCCPS